MENKRYIKKIDVEYFNFEDSIIVLKAGNSYELNDVSNLVFMEFNGENTVKQITEKVCAEYEGDSSQMLKDIMQLCREMEEAEIIEEI